MTKILFMNSGGMDSLVGMKKLIMDGHEVHYLYLDYGQISNQRARIAVEIIANKLNIPPQNRNIIKIDFSESVIDTLEHDYLPVNPFIVVGSGRATAYLQHLMRVIGGSFAYKINAQILAGGFRVSNNIVDTVVTSFYNKITGIYENIQFYSPLQGLNREGVKNLALELGLTVQDLRETVSCMALADRACGTCLKCRERAELGIEETIIL